MPSTIESFRAAQSITAGARQFVRLAFDASNEINGLIPILPVPGPNGSINARDGRAFRVADMQKVSAASELPMLVDVDHESESMFGGSTAAVAWIESFRVDGGALFGNVAWTAEGREHVRTKRYRFSSPVLELDAETRTVQRVISCSLTNRPALRMSEVQAFSLRFAQKGSAVPKHQFSTIGLTQADIERAEAHSRRLVAEHLARSKPANENAIQREILSRGILTQADLDRVKEYDAARGR